MESPVRSPNRHAEASEMFTQAARRTGGKRHGARVAAAGADESEDAPVKRLRLEEAPVQVQVRSMQR